MGLMDILIEPTTRNFSAIEKLAKQTKTRAKDWKLKLSRINENGIYTATAINEVINRSVLFDEWDSRDEVSLFYDKKGLWHPRIDFRLMDNWK